MPYVQDVVSEPDLIFRPFDLNMQIDLFIGADQGDVAAQALTTIDRDSWPHCMGLFKGTSAEIISKLDNLRHAKPKLWRSCAGKCVLIVRSTVGPISIQDEADQALAILEWVRSELSRNATMVLFSDSAIRPKTPPGLFYSHVVAKDTPPTPLQFARVVARRLEVLAINQAAEARPKFSAQNAVCKEGEALAPLLDGEAIYRIWRRGVPFDLFCNLKATSQALVVFGQDALQPGSKQLPTFFRWSWGRDLPFSTIVLNDPTLFLDSALGGGWFVGEPDHHYAVTAVEIVRSIAERMGLPPTKVVFFGASAGGFTSLMMASMLKGASAVVDVPQIDLSRYFAPANILHLVRAALRCASLEDAYSRYPERLNVLDCFSRYGLPNICYLQNSNDLTAGHLRDQFGAFLAGYSRLLVEAPDSRRAKVMIETYDRYHLAKGGHFPLHKHGALEHIRAAVEQFCCAPPAPSRFCG